MFFYYSLSMFGLQGSSVYLSKLYQTKNLLLPVSNWNVLKCLHVNFFINLLRQKSLNVY